MAIEESKVGASCFEQLDGWLLKPRPSSRLDHLVVAITGPGSACGKPVSKCVGSWMVSAPIQPLLMIPRRPTLCRTIPHDFRPSDI